MHLLEFRLASSTISRHRSIQQELSASLRFPFRSSPDSVGPPPRPQGEDSPSRRPELAREEGVPHGRPRSSGRCARPGPAGRSLLLKRPPWRRRLRGEAWQGGRGRGLGNRYTRLLGSRRRGLRGAPTPPPAADSGHPGVPAGRGGAETLYLAGTHVPIMATGQADAARQAIRAPLAPGRPPAPHTSSAPALNRPRRPSPASPGSRPSDRARANGTPPAAFWES